MFQYEHLYVLRLSSIVSELPFHCQHHFFASGSCVRQLKSSSNPSHNICCDAARVQWPHLIWAPFALVRHHVVILVSSVLCIHNVSYFGFHQQKIVSLGSDVGMDSSASNLSETSSCYGARTVLVENPFTILLFIHNYNYSVAPIL